MKEKLPHVFANKVGSISNNKKVYYSDLEHRTRKKDDNNSVIDKFTDELKEHLEINSKMNTFIKFA